jgi:hypothetical protein
LVISLKWCIEHSNFEFGQVWTKIACFMLLLNFALHSDQPGQTTFVQLDSNQSLWSSHWTWKTSEYYIKIISMILQLLFLIILIFTACFENAKAGDCSGPFILQGKLLIIEGVQSFNFDIFIGSIERFSEHAVRAAKNPSSETAIRFHTTIRLNSLVPYEFLVILYQLWLFLLQS